MDYFFLFINGVVAAAPFLLSKVVWTSPENKSSLTNLSKVLFLFVIFNLLKFVVFKRLLLFNEIFWFSNITDFVLATTVIYAVTRYSPIGSLNGLIAYPVQKNGLKINLLIIIFFLCSSLLLYLKTSLHKDINSAEGYELLCKALNSSYLFMPVSLALQFYFIMAEEFVYRYFAINTLRSILNDKHIIIVSSLIWMLMHQGLYVNLFALGLIFAYLYIKTDSLVSPILIHFLLNVAGLTQAFYLYYSRMFINALTPLQYALALFFVLVCLYFIIEYCFNKIRWR